MLNFLGVGYLLIYPSMSWILLDFFLTFIPRLKIHMGFFVNRAIRVFSDIQCGLLHVPRCQTGQILGFVSRPIMLFVVR
jgi:hypothetical protein